MSSTTASPFKIAIIGSGLSGLSLALSLITIFPSPSSSSSLPALKIAIYESRPSPLNIGGALMLSPNGLKILDKLGIYSSLRSKGYNFRNSFFQDALTNEIVETFPFGDETIYDYDALRIYRSELLDSMLQRLASLGANIGSQEAEEVNQGPMPDGKSTIQILWSHKFARILSDSSRTTEVTFAFTDGSSATADLLIGADGIHSSVRQQPGLLPSLHPLWTGKAGITASVPTSSLGLPAEQIQPGRMEDAKAFTHPLVLTLQHPKLGGFVIAPQDRDGGECLVGRQMTLKEDPGRDGVKRLMETEEGRKEVVAALREGVESEDGGYPDIVRNAVRSFEEMGKVNVWPFYVVPKLGRWLSWVDGEGEKDGEAGKNKEKAGMVVILGDAAHAIPPTAGQGVNQALEDVWTFALVLKKVLEGNEGGKGLELGEALEKWQAWRQERVDGVLHMNRQIDLRRMPEDQKTEEEKSRAKVELKVDWLYKINFEEVVEGLLSEG